MTPNLPVLCILDGWVNVMKRAQTHLLWRRRRTLIDNGDLPQRDAYHSRARVGLPTGQMGNSELGIPILVQGVVAMDWGQIDLAIEDGHFMKRGAHQLYKGSKYRRYGACHGGFV